MTKHYSSSSSSIFLLTTYLLLLSLTLIISSSSSTVEAIGDHKLSWIQKTGQCQGSVAECMMEDELYMDSENSRRILATTQYISYGALQRDTVPCSRRGASYYNCQQSAQANPYSRGCSTLLAAVVERFLTSYWAFFCIIV